MLDAADASQRSWWVLCYVGRAALDCTQVIGAGHHDGPAPRDVGAGGLRHRGCHVVPRSRCRSLSPLNAEPTSRKVNRRRDVDASLPGQDIRQPSCGECSESSVARRSFGWPAPRLGRLLVVGDATAKSSAHARAREDYLPRRRIFAALRSLGDDDLAWRPRSPAAIKGSRGRGGEPAGRPHGGTITAAGHHVAPAGVRRSANGTQQPSASVWANGCPPSTFCGARPRRHGRMDRAASRMFGERRRSSALLATTPRSGRLARLAARR